MPDADDIIPLGRSPLAGDEDALEQDFGPDLGPDDHDLDLLDGSWEARYYAGHERPRDWQNIYLALSLLVLIAILVPAILVFAR